MKKHLIIYAHPQTKGHCEIIKKTIQDKLIENKIDYDLIDLYTENYNPLLQKEEHYTSGFTKLNQDTKEYQKKITDAETIHIIYPVWWGTIPAILKGFFDRTLTPKYAFKFEKVIGNIARPVGLMKGKKAMIYQTSGTKVILHKIFQGGRSTKTITKDILGTCGFKTKVIHFGGCTKNPEEKRQEIENKIQKIKF